MTNLATSQVNLANAKAGLKILHLFAASFSISTDPKNSRPISFIRFTSGKSLNQQKMMDKI
jgi:hypothetical protein